VKKFFLFPTLLLFFVLSLPAVFAAEEAVPVQANNLSRDARVTVSPFEFSLAPEEWLESKPGEIFSAGTHAPDFTLPVLQGNPAPIRYPRWAVRRGWQGDFLIAVEVLENGTVGRWQVLQSTGHPLLDEAATQAVLKWKFSPATEHGREIAMCVQLPIRFELRHPQGR